MAEDPGSSRDAAEAAAPFQLEREVDRPLRDAAQGVALTGAERQRRYRERRAAEEPRRRYVEVRKRERRTSRPRRWARAVAELLELQAEYGAWLEDLPESLRSSRTAELLEFLGQRLDLECRGQVNLLCSSAKSVTTRPSSMCRAIP